MRVNSIALEGIIDLVLFDSAAKCGLIVDWKTNDVDGSDPKNIEELRKLYRSQIATYWKAMVAITRLNVEAGLYSTCLGEFLPYSTDELEKEWTRLQKLSFPDFQSKVEGD